MRRLCGIHRTRRLLRSRWQRKVKHWIGMTMSIYIYTRMYQLYVRTSISKGGIFCYNLYIRWIDIHLLRKFITIKTTISKFHLYTGPVSMGGNGLYHPPRQQILGGEDSGKSGFQMKSKIKFFSNFQ